MLGIDVSKAHLAAALLDRGTERFRWERSVPNTPAGVQTLLTLTPREVPLVVEPTGRYSLLVVEQATSAGRTVLLAPPRKAKAYLRSLTSRAKTDRLDARGLALFAASRPKAEALRPFPLKGEGVQRLEQLLTARRGVTAALVSLEQQRRELPHATAVLTQAVADLRERRRQLDEQIAQLTRQEQQFPGKRVGQRRLTKEGDAELRRLFYLAAQANLTCKQSPFKEQFERELEKGLSKTAALNAVARKLARVCWSLVKHGGAYDPRRVHHPPPSLPPADRAPAPAHDPPAAAPTPVPPPVGTAKSP